MKVNELISEEKIQERVSEIASSITEDYQYKEQYQELVLLIVLKGAMMFASDLMKNLPEEMSDKVTIEFIKVSSYAGTESKGELTFELLPKHLEEKSVIIVEDIIDSGITITSLKEFLKKQGVSNLKVCSFLKKDFVSLPIDYLGFEIPDKFVVGYGLDYDQQFRTLPYLGILER